MVASFPGPIWVQGESGNEATWRVQANSISCFVCVREKEKGIHHSSLNLFFVLFIKKAKGSLVPRLSLRANEKSKGKGRAW